MLISVLSGPLASAAIAENAPVSVGSRIPGLSLPSIMGGTLDLDGYKGKTLLLTFYTTWSRSCVDALKFQKALSGTYKDLEIVTVAFENKTSTVKDFVEKNGINFISLIDKKNKYLNEFQILIIPTAYLIDGNGTIRNIYVDFDDRIKQSMISGIEDLLDSGK